MRGGYYRASKTPKKFPDYGPGKCLYCGAPLPKGCRKYCCMYHGERYRYETANYEIVTWAGFRLKILKRDKNLCVDCGDVAEEVHHRLPIYKGGEEFDEDNCIPLCIPCHLKRHKGRNTDMETGRIKQSKLLNF